MGLFDKGIAGTIKGILGGAGEAAKDLREAIKGKELDPTVLAELQSKSQELETQLKLAQMKVNEAEAKSGNLFVAGWRPYIGWVGGAALTYQFVLRPLIVGFFGIGMPGVDTGGLYPLILGMLGIGGYRTYEKLKGVQDKH